MFAINPLDEKFMNLALALALKGKGHVQPNPMVGAVLVQDVEGGEKIVVGEGYHGHYGGPHAEVAAIQDCIDRGGHPEGLTLYCTLEPCCHTQKQTPPCVDLIIQKKIKKVFVAVLDPNPLVAGQGVEKLRAAGIEVVVGIAEQRAVQLNEVFFKYMRLQRPFLHLKWAQSLDGQMAMQSGESKWITGEAARALTHSLRAQYGAVMVGLKTLRQDNPELTIRHQLEGQYPSPRRIVLGRRFTSADLGLKVFCDEGRAQTVLISQRPLEQKIKDYLEKHQISFYEMQTEDLKEAFAYLASIKISGVLVEGGAELLTGLLKERLFDKVTVFVAPKIFGDQHRKLGDLNIHSLSEVIDLVQGEWEKWGEDFSLTAYPREQN